MTISSAFLWRFLDDVWDLLPTEDRELFQAYWLGQIRIAAGIEQSAIEASLSTEVSEVPVFLTERWNRFVMDDGTTDQFQQIDLLILSGTAAIGLSRETAFFDTLKISNSSGQIPEEETIRFFDDSVRSLRYGKIIPGTLSIKLGSFEFTQNRDYVVNLTEGTVQALDDGRIPTTDLLTITYQHEEYTRDLDYEVDELGSTIQRTASSSIASGATVSATYTYNGSPTLQLEGTNGAVDFATLTDATKDFSGLLPGRTLTIKSGVNAGTYPINSVISPAKLRIAGSFPQSQANDVVYSINAFPHGMSVDSSIVSIPFLQNLIGEPTTVLIEDVDYRVSGGILAVRCAFQRSEIGPTDLRERQAWAEVTQVDKETPYRNFGVLIDFFRKNSEEYKLALQGLWYTFWTGSTPGNLQRGLHILLGLPFARRAGTVTRVDTTVAAIDITEPSGRVITYSIPDGLSAVVAAGEEAARFDSLTTGVQIIDRNNQPGFVSTDLGRAGIERFLTSNATRGTGATTDETRALTLLETHLFLPRVLTEAITQRINVNELVTFLNNMKPNWTEFVFSFAVEESETLTFTETLDPLDLALDLTTTVSGNECNKSFSSGNFFLHSLTGEIIGGGTQATGNFRDFTADFAALGIDKNDFVKIEAGFFKGFHRVLKRVSSSVLSLEISDALIASAIGLEYFVLTEEQCALGHDAIRLGDEHVLLTGTDYPAPTTLNTKTDIDLDGVGLNNEEAKALLLVDIGIAGGEVQAITDADVALNEFDVAISPGTVTRAHEIASAALKRTNNVGPVVTDAYAI